MSLFLGRRLMLCLLAAAMIGCARMDKPRGQSPLKRPEMSTDSVVLDIFFVRFPFGDPEVNGPLWQEIDEQRLSVDQRRRLLENGFRVGILAGPLPVRLSQLMELAGKPAPSGEPTEATLTDLVGEPTVTRRHLQLRAGHRGVIFASDAREELPVLLRDPSGGVSGRSYFQARPVLAVKPFLETDGRVRVELVPEVQYGPIRQHRVVGDDQGILRFEPSCERCVLDKMALDAILASGDMLIMSSLPNRPGSLGHHFFTQSDSGAEEQKLLIIRLSQTQHDDQFEGETADGHVH